ncbi:MAG: AAA family ATPase [Muribaculaceae bacterium]|nr:AAA family ATPase [Muribaculaceae bacterium]
MKKNETDIAGRLRDFLPFAPLPIQEGLIMALGCFAEDADPRGVFILNGYAGTGKTSIVGAFVKALESLGRKTVVLAPTGRAAKVAGGMSGGKSSTIHRRIYHPQAGAAPGSETICLSPNRDKDTLFIVDEASLVTGGSGRGLLENLVRHVYSAPGCRMLLVGDTAQLPPVGQEDSPAMKEETLRRLGLAPVTYTLDIPVRQEGGSGILYNATTVRHALFKAMEKPAASPLPSIFTSGVFVNAPVLPKLPGLTAQGVAKPEVPPLKVSGFDDIRAVNGYELPDRLSTSWSEVGPEETIIITRSNKRANDYNMAIRNQVMYAEEPLQQGDRIVIAKNDYYWSAANKLRTFIANGDVARVEWVGRVEKMYGRYFVDVELRLIQGGERVSAKLMLRSLTTEGPSIPKAEMDRFFTHVMAEQGGGEHERIMAASQDPYYNALQAKYAYCVTCHKAQGGQWRHVYIDMAGLRKENLDISYLRWLYTALTRGVERVWLINPPADMLED